MIQQMFFQEMSWQIGKTSSVQRDGILTLGTASYGDRILQEWCGQINQIKQT